MISIDIQTARRFILGKQGLWPGRRWRGIKGTEQAMRAIEYLQLDPLQIIARSHDITLHSRVLDYKPDMWETVTYKKRKFFYRQLCAIEEPSSFSFQPENLALIWFGGMDGSGKKIV